MTRTTIITVLLLCMSLGVYAQQGVTGYAKLRKAYEHSGPTKDFSFSIKGNASETTLWIDQLFADIEVEGIEGPEVKITSYGYEGLPEKAKGLKPLGSVGPENTGLGLIMTQDGGKVTLGAAHNKANDAKYIIRVPKNIKLNINYHSWRAGDVLIKNMTNEVEVKSQVGDLRIENVSGPIVAYTLSSDMDVIFSSLSQKSPSSISSTSGDIDITLPPSVKGTFKMSSISGGVYTDVDFDLNGEAGNTRRITGSSATGKLNGGGVEVLFKSISGDIYVRKSK